MPVGVVDQTRWLLGARWRIALAALRRGARWRRLTYAVVAAALAFLGLVAWGASYIVTIAIVELTAPGARRAPIEAAGALLAAQQRADVVVSTTLSGILSLAILISFTVALGALYLSSDLDMLLSAPVDRRSVFASKLLGGLLPSLAVVLLMAVVPLVGHGQAQGHGWPYYAAAGAALLLLPLLPMAIGSLAVMVIVRHVSARRLGDVVAVMVVAMTLSIAVVAGSARQLQEALTFRDLLGVLDGLRVPYSPAEWLTRGIVAAARGDVEGAVAWLGFVAVLSALALAVLVALADSLYYDGWSRLQSADRRRELRGSRMPWNRVDRAESLGRPTGVLRWLPQQVAAVVGKDARVIPRDLTNMAQVLSPLSIGVFFVLQRLLYPVRLGGFERAQDYLDPLLVMLSTAVAVAVASMIMSRFTLTAFSIEGKAWWVLKSAPLARRDLIFGKFVVAYLPFVALGSALVVLLEATRALADARSAGTGLAGMVTEFDVGLVAYGCFAVATIGAGVLAINLALGAARPNLAWDTPHEMLTPDLGCLSLVLYGGYGFVATASLLVPAATAGFPAIRHAAWLWAAGLALGVGVTAVVVAGSLALAARELDAIGD